ncbi:MAG TPA: glycerophosphodiester phosphodiesterase family protein, partial [Thermomicrobiales bacterium]|nr:glycerophosphodiester phosphodiesterase family protein [Thermomicrobiales bacterium]
MIAHRGASAMAPENTLEAFRVAVEAGADMIETDAHLAHDGSIVLIHDAELGRTTNCAGSVSATGMADLRACDAGYWFAFGETRGHPYRGLGLRVPTLDDAFELLESLGCATLVNVEIKNLPGEIGFDPSERLAATLVDRLRALGAIERVIVSSF